MADDRAPAEQDFFVGYLPAMPRESGTATRRFVGAIALCVCGVAVATVSLVRVPAAATWTPESKVVTGVLSAEPYPVLHVGSGSNERAVILVGFGKAGAPDALQSLAGQQVSLKSSVEISRGDIMVYELAADGDMKPLGPGEVPAVQSLGRVKVRGEIIDPKCYAGTMKPGEGKIHRACAIRCISGGIPPVLAARTENGLSWYILTGPNGERIGADILDFVADNVEVEGELTRRGTLQRLAIDPTTIRRLEEPFSP